MAFALAPGITFCDAGGRFVFLDVPKDRYFCLGADPEEGFRRFVAGAPLAEADEARLRTLAVQGLLVPAPADVRPEPCRPPASIRMPLFQENLPVSRRRVLAAAASLIRARIMLRYRSLHSQITSIQAMKDGSRGVNQAADERLVEISVAFRRAALITGSLNQCLANSIAIVRHARSADLRAELVLGVKLRPFRAHAWVLANDVLISDAADTVSPFTPILVV
ncbi:lasso peptide biosynthesis B2 protein [Sphingosinithalassobacter sp. CS137]|uniref:lasso peptide biosynthesis B2 protein n=1 Tax=Sphingosinithalassobacter sp. CS137 TaxID=2762748 RepID=UPI00165E35D3|nr:lasso peptide biosynthesis B2 protein [Sphingosinithalassobacter sp. CS137]